MNDGSWRRLRELFERALEMPQDERDGLLRDLDATDPVLAGEVRSLLSAHDASGDFLEHPPRGLAAEILEEATEDGLIGQLLGAYRVERRIGRGGAGSVYAASRTDGAFVRHVAIKVVRRGVATPEMLRRFEAERRILASIDHPSIARLLDAGSTVDGRPYLVMELIDGEPIDLYCDRRSLPLRERLRLFVQACAAVQVAHQNLVIHRDLKPGNILVTAEGVVKLLDFGIAKLFDPEDLGDETVAEQRVLTPDFASPEQFGGGAVTTASDVYSLGVILYEMLCGQRPYRMAGLSPVQQQERASASDPPLPSVAAQRSGSDDRLGPASAADARALTPERLARALAGDLDTIVSMALRKEPDRRYASVRQLADDIERHLSGRPVAARPDTLAYRAGKFVRRNRVAVAAAAVVLALSIGALVLLAQQSRRVAAEAARVRAVNDFLQQILRSPDPGVGLGADVTVVEALLAAVPRIEGAFSGQPDIEAAVRQGIAETMLQIGIADEAATQFAEALRLRRQLYGDGDPGVGDSLNGAGEARFDLGDLDGAERYFTEALSQRRHLLGGGDPAVAVVLDNLGNVQHERGDLDGAERLYREAQSIWVARAPDSAAVATSLHNLGAVAHDRGDLETAEALYSESIAMSRRALGDHHPDVATSLNNLATLRHDRGDLDGAEPLYRESVAIMRGIGAPRHPMLATSLDNLGALLRDRGRLDESRAAWEEVAAILRQQSAGTAAELPWVLESLGDLALERGDAAEAIALYQEALDGFERNDPVDDPSVGRLARSLADLFEARGEGGKAAALRAQAAASDRSAASRDHKELRPADARG